jgi:formamidopyrimidine-DNA glycosylase
MPELPEVETVRRTLAPIVGAEISSTWWSGKNLRLNTPVDLKGLRSACRHAEVESIRRLGKYILIDLAGRPGVILVHLGMSGRLRHFAKGSLRPPHTHVEWRFKDDRLLRYSDPRRFGNVQLLERGREREHASLAKLGPDPLEDRISGSSFRAGCQRTKRPIKVALLDQSLVAGVGNIYASEALWQAGIHPSTPACKLSLVRCQRLIDSIIEVLSRALAHGGTSLKDFVSADGHAGEHSHYLWVYDREGEACPSSSCPGKVRRTVQQQRATYYCPRCQRK